MADKPSKLFKDFLTEHTTFSNAVKSAGDLLKDKYIKGKGKDAAEKADDKMFIPGKMYTFAYLGREKIGPKEFVDHRPVMISLGQTVKNGTLFESGIDLNVIPPKLRMVVLDLLYKKYAPIIESNVSNIENGRKGKKALALSNAAAKNLLNGTGWEYACCTFDKRKIASAAIIDYADWPAMGAVYTNSMRGMQLNDIYKEYMRKLAKKEKKES